VRRMFQSEIPSESQIDQPSFSGLLARGRSNYHNMRSVFAQFELGLLSPASHESRRTGGQRRDSWHRMQMNGRVSLSDLSWHAMWSGRDHFLRMTIVDRKAHKCSTQAFFSNSINGGAQTLKVEHRVRFRPESETALQRRMDQPPLPIVSNKADQNLTMRDQSLC
jgi:hypothetical protein